jgi:WD repeat-containing protein 55
VDAGGATVWDKPKAHKAPVNVVRAFAGHMLASGDDDGGVKLWDTRVSSSAAAPLAFADHEDVITDMVVEGTKATLLTASGDGKLGVYDLRKPRLAASTEQEDDELLSLAVVKGGGAVTAGTQDGVLLTWQWGKWAPKEGDAATYGYGADRFRGHPQSIDALLVLDDDTLITGSSDGIIRIVTVAPNKLVGVLGEHGDDPIERLAWDRTRRLVASASHDLTLRFWDVGALLDEGEEDDDEEGEGGAAAAATTSSSSSAAGGGKAKKSGSKAKATGGSRFVDLPALALPSGGGGDDEDDDDSDDEDMDDSDADDSDDDEEDMGVGRGRGGAAKGRAAAVAASGKAAKGGKGGKGAKGGKGKGASFFDDL